MAPVTTRGLLLRSHPYGETSLILRFFTADMGTVGVMARGAKKRGSKNGNGLDTFTSGVLTLFVKSSRDLQTMKDFAPTRARPGLGGDLVRFGGASLIAEMILKNSGEASSRVMFEAVERALDNLEECPADALVGSILREGWAVVSALGYHPEIDLCIECGERLGPDEMGRFDFGAGGIRCAACSTGASGPRLGPKGRAQVRALLVGEMTELTRPRAHLRLLGDFVTYHLTDQKPLVSFGFLLPLFPKDPS